MPYASDVSDALGIPVFDFYSFMNWFQAGSAPSILSGTRRYLGAITIVIRRPSSSGTARS